MGQEGDWEVFGECRSRNRGITGHLNALGGSCAWGSDGSCAAGGAVEVRQAEQLPLFLCRPQSWHWVLLLWLAPLHFVTVKERGIQQFLHKKGLRPSVCLGAL